MGIANVTLRMLVLALLAVSASRLNAVTKEYRCEPNADTMWAKNGSNWTTQVTNLDRALELAAIYALANPTHVVQVWARQGTYTPLPRHANLSDSSANTYFVSSGIQLYGGFVGGSGGETLLSQRPAFGDACDPEVTNPYSIIKGLYDANSTHHVLHVFTLYEYRTGSKTSAFYDLPISAGVRIDGFEIYDAGAVGGDGGGIYAPSFDADVTVTVQNCLIRDNATSYNGGGLAMDGLVGGGGSDANLDLINCKFLENSSTNGTNSSTRGGGLWAESAELTVTDCCFTSNTTGTGRGGAMYLEGSSWEVEDTSFTSNVATAFNAYTEGGAIFADGDVGTVSRCLFEANQTTGGSGAIHSSGDTTISTTRFKGNSGGLGTPHGAKQGGAIRFNGTLTIQSCDFVGNTVGDYGGAIYQNGGDLTIVRSLFADNSSELGGGALYQPENPAASSKSIANCSFIGNSVTGGNGGAIWNYDASPVIVDCLFYDNSASGLGGAVYQGNGGDAPQFVNCTITENSAATSGGGGIYIVNDSGHTMTIRNSIIWNNCAGVTCNTAVAQINDTTNGRLALGDVTYSNIQGGWSGTGNTSGDPKFVCAGSGDFRILTSSAAWNTGNNSLIPSDVLDVDEDGNTSTSWDLDNVTRIQNTTVNMGAFERTCMADWDGSGALTIFDYTAFVNDLYAWEPRADLNHDCVFDNSDYVIFNAAYNAGCPSAQCP